MRFYRQYYALTASLLQSRSRATLKAHLAKRLSGYLASQVVIMTLVSNQRTNTRILLSRDLARLNFYFRTAKIISVGDSFGPARYAELYHEVEEGNCLPYLTRLDISAVIVRPHSKEPWWSGFYDKFRPQLKAYGFREYRTLEDNVAIFLRSDIAPSSELTPVTQ